MKESSEAVRGVNQEGSAARTEAPATVPVRARNNLRCSFCHRTDAQVEKFISGVSPNAGSVYICEGCIGLCNEILADDAARRGEPAAKPHPEKFCERCKRPNVWSWHAPSPLWNRVMRNSVTGEDRYSVVCPPCFAELAAVLIGDVTWCFKPHDVDVSALWTDSDGREWDAQSCLWRATIRERGSVVLAVDPSRFTPRSTALSLSDQPQ